MERRRVPPCSKRGYDSERAAKLAHRSAGFRLRAYRCESCRLWHVCNQDKR